jgi:hypothetical protein
MMNMNDEMIMMIENLYLNDIVNKKNDYLYVNQDNHIV